MKRRNFLSAGAGALAATSLPQGVSAQSTPLVAETHRIGNFLLVRTVTGLQIAHRAALDRVIWDTVADGNFISAETATADIREFGTPEGSFEITDTVSASFNQPTIESIVTGGDTAVVTGKLSGAARTIGYKLAFETVSTAHLRFAITVEAANVNRIRLVSGSVADEAIFGFGQQPTTSTRRGSFCRFWCRSTASGVANLSSRRSSTTWPIGAAARPS
jgi:alpha-glucosidase